MPIFSFTFAPPHAGCVKRLTLMTPWNKAVAHPQTGQPMSPNDAAWLWLQGYAAQRDQNGNPPLCFPPECSDIKCKMVGVGGEGNPQPMILAVETAEPTVDRQQVNAPYGTPVGNGHMLTMPPVQGKPNERTVPQGMYEDLTDCGLTNNDDPLLGGGDGHGGTFTDFNPNDRMETVRQLAMPPSPKVHERQQ